MPQAPAVFVSADVCEVIRDVVGTSTVRASCRLSYTGSRLPVCDEPRRASVWSADGLGVAGQRGGGDGGEPWDRAGGGSSAVAEGVSVVAGARNVEALAGIDGVTAVVADLAVAGEPSAWWVRRWLATAASTCSSTTSAGRPSGSGGFLSLTDADFEASLQLNFFSALRATRAAVADMVTRGSGTIVNVTSVNAFFEPDGAVIDYGAAKAALVNAAKALSQELGPQGIRVTSVAPAPSRPTCG